MDWKRVVAWSGGWISGIAYETLKDDKSIIVPPPIFNIFLVGENGVGKDMILCIVRDLNLESNMKPTKKLTRERITLPKFMLPKRYITTINAINTAGSPENDDENIQARKGLPKGKNTKYVYVFRVDKFFSDENYQKRVQWDIENSKEQCDRDENGWDLVIIGTHRDKCNVGDELIQNLSVKLSEQDKFRCGILNLKLVENDGKRIQLAILLLLFSIKEFHYLFFIDYFLEEQQ